MPSEPEQPLNNHSTPQPDEPEAAGSAAVEPAAAHPEDDGEKAAQDAPAPETADLPTPPTPTPTDKPTITAAEREYQNALRAAKALGLDREVASTPEDEKNEAAGKLAAKLGLDQPTVAEAPPTTLFDEPSPEEEPEPEDTDDEILGPDHGDNRAWFVLNTYSGHENRVKTYLERRIESMDVGDRIFRVVVPTEEELEIRGGQRRQVHRKLLPGYVLVEMLLDDDTWHVVRNTPGVTGFVGAEKPHPLPREEVKSILAQMRVVEPRLRVGFEVNDTVRVMEGPFQDFMGPVDEINMEKGKVRVLISMFGRETPVELDFVQVEKV